MMGRQLSVVVYVAAVVAATLTVVFNQATGKLTHVTIDNSRFSDSRTNLCANLSQALEFAS